MADAVEGFEMFLNDEAADFGPLAEDGISFRKGREAFSRSYDVIAEFAGRSLIVNSDKADYGLKVLNEALFEDYFVSHRSS
jgi:hypothetical protein